MSAPPLVVVTGVSGSGKSTVGAALGRRLSLEYGDADDFHSRSNLDKMRAGEALSESDREPWLAAIGVWLRDRSDTGAVVSCSALRRRHRDRLREAAPHAVFLHLHGQDMVLRDRIRQRKDHFMPESLLVSQLATLDPLEPDEHGFTADIEDAPDAIVAAFLRWSGVPFPG